MQGHSPARVGLMGLVRGSITHASGADGQSGCLRVWLAATSAPCYTLRLSSTGPFAPLTPHRRFCCLQMGRTVAVSLVDRHRVFSVAKCSGFFRIAKRYREVNLAQNEGHASAVRTGHKRQFCACNPRGGREAFGGVPTTAFPAEKRWKRPNISRGSFMRRSRFRVTPHDRGHVLPRSARR